LNESAWSTTPASNDGADSTIGTVANTSSPTTVDDWIKGIMASRAKARLDQGGGLVAGGTSTALTVTTNQSLSSSHIANGLRLCVRTASAATGAATIAVDGLTAVDIKKQGGTAIASGDWASGDILDLVYSSTATAFIAANVSPPHGIVLLTSGTWSAQATGDIVLTAYSAYRGLKFVVSGVKPATDAVNFLMRFSTDGGSNYLATLYRYASIMFGESTTGGGLSSASDSSIPLAQDIGNDATHGYNGEITILNHTSTAFYPRATWHGDWVGSANSNIVGSGGGHNAAANNVDAIRFLFSSGNISTGNYAVYGLA